MSDEVGSAHISVSADTAQFKRDLVALKASARKLGDAVGDSFMGGFLKKVRKGLKELVTSFSISFGYIVAAVNVAAQRIRKAVQKMVLAFGTLRAAAKKAWTAVRRQVISAALAAGAAIDRLGNTIRFHITRALLPVILAYQGLRAQVVKAVSRMVSTVSRHFRELRTDVVAIMETLRFKIGLTVFKIQNAIRDILDKSGITRIVNEARVFGRNLAQAIGSGFNVGVKVAQGFIRRGLDGIKDNVVNPLRAIAVVVEHNTRTIARNLGDVISNSVIGKVAAKAKSLKDKIADSFPFKAVASGVARIRAQFRRIGDAVGDAVPSGASAKFKASMKLLLSAAKRTTNAVSRQFRQMSRSVRNSMRRMDSTVRLVILSIAFAAQPLAALSSGLSAVGVAMLAASAAAVAALAPLVGILAPLVLGIAAAAAGFKDLKKFAPEAADALGGLKDQFNDVAVPALMEAWGDSLAGFFDTLTGFLDADIFAGIGEAFAGMTDSITAVLSGPVGQGFKEALAGPLTDALGTLLQAVGPLLSVFLQFLTAAAPFAQILAEMFLAWATNLEAAFSGAVADGSFQAFMEQAMTALQVIFGLLGNIGDIIGIVFSAGLGPGTEMLQMISDLLAEFEAWLQSAEGQAAMTQFFDGIMIILPPLLELVGALGIALADLVTPEIMAQTAGLLTSLADILPVITDLLNIVAEAGVLDILTTAIGALGKIITPLIDPLSEFLSVFSETLIGVLEELGPAFGTIGEVFGRIFEALTPVLPVLGQLVISLVESLLPAVIQIVDAFLPLIDIILPLLVPLIQTLAPVLGKIAMVFAEIFTAIMPFVGILLEALIPLLPPLIEFIGVLAGIIGDTLVSVIQILLPFLEPMIGMMASLVPILELLTPILELVGVLIGLILEVVMQILQPLLDFAGNTDQMTKAIDKFSGWIETAIGWIENIIDVIEDWINNLDLGKWASDTWTAIQEHFQAMLDWIGDLPEKIGDIFESIGTTIKNAFKSAFNYVADAWNNTIGQLSWTVPNWVPKLGGNTISAPKIPKFAAGTIAFTPTLGVFGEAGAEALVPLNRPLNMVDPSVRGLSAIAQGLPLPGVTGPTIAEGAIVINTRATNGRVVAESVLDRIVTYSR